MKNESVAILDVKSYEITFYLGSKGVNNTLVLYDSFTEKYEGFSTDGFFDETSFRQAVVKAITRVRQNFEGIIGEIFVGVPSAFVSLVTKGHTISFPSKRKISSVDIESLYESGLNDLLAQGRCIRRSAMYFTLGDNRKYFNASDAYGVPTTLLKGALCYYFINEQFYVITKKILNDLDFKDIKFLPSTLAQALYLLPEKRREGYAFLLDVGFITSSISVVYGNGIVHEETFNFGLGTILAELMDGLSIEYSLAEEILATANVSGGGVPKDLTWTSEKGDASFSVREINDVIKCSLDVLCENVENFFSKHYHAKQTAVFSVNPIGLTGEGISGVAGIAEHISRRLNRLTEIVYPDLPYYDKPTFSSTMSLLNMALGDRKKKRWIYRIFNNFGGNKK